ACPACVSDSVRVFYEMRGAPVNSVRLLTSRSEALNFSTGDVRLAFCDGCGFVFNAAFDRELVEYSPACEETQGFSPFFSEWQRNLARRLVERYSLYDKQIVEVGCGKGEFLALLCELGGNNGVGYDPAYVPGRIRCADRIRFIREFYDDRCTSDGDFLCCKMTLEHISDPLNFIGMIRASLRNLAGTAIFFQVPNIARILSGQAFWDIYYEHCSYFSLGSLIRLFRRAAFKMLAAGREYGDQYVTVELWDGEATENNLSEEDDLEDLKLMIESFARKVPGRIDEWRKRLASFRDKHLKVVIWGGGSKGVSFLSTVDVAGAVEYAVDINPHMKGHYLARSGVEIVSPSALCEYRPDVVIIM